MFSPPEPASIPVPVPAQRYVEADLEHELGVWDAQRLPLQLGVEPVPAVAARVLPGGSVADHHAEARGDRLGPAEARVPLVGAVGVEGNITDGRQRELVQDAGIVDGERGREDAVAANSVRVGRREPQRRGGASKRARRRADSRSVHERRSSSLKECERAPKGARGERPSDCEGRRPGGIGLDGIGGKNVAARRRADRMRVAVEPVRQGRQVGRDKGHGLRGEAAERALVAAMTARRVLARRALSSLTWAQSSRRVAEQRLELGGDRRVIGAGEGGRGESEAASRRRKAER